MPVVLMLAGSVYGDYSNVISNLERAEESHWVLYKNGTSGSQYCWIFKAGRIKGTGGSNPALSWRNAGPLLDVPFSMLTRAIGEGVIVGLQVTFFGGMVVDNRFRTASHSQPHWESWSVTQRGVSVTKEHFWMHCLPRQWWLPHSGHWDIDPGHYVLSADGKAPPSYDLLLVTSRSCPFHPHCCQDIKRGHCNTNI